MKNTIPHRKKENKIGMMKDELGRKIKKEFEVLRPKTYRYLTDDDCVDKKVKNAKKCVIKREITFEDYKKCLENN